MDDLKPEPSRSGFVRFKIESASRHGFSDKEIRGNRLRFRRESATIKQMFDFANMGSMMANREAGGDDT
jgi:hypothetical protein